MEQPRPTLFISHASADDPFVSQLQQTLENLDQRVWIDSRQLISGDPLLSAIQSAIDRAGAFTVVVSPAALHSTWVGKELQYALKRQKRQPESEPFRIIPLSLVNTALGALGLLFDEQPLYIPVATEPGGLDEALSAILAALGLKRPADRPPTPRPIVHPLEELVLELSEPNFEQFDGKRRAIAFARLVHQPATLPWRAIRASTTAMPPKSCCCWKPWRRG